MLIFSSSTLFPNYWAQLLRESCHYQPVTIALLEKWVKMHIHSTTNLITINIKSKKETRCYTRKSVGMNNFVVRDESMKTCFYRNMSSPLSAGSVPLIRKISFSKCNYTSSKDSEKFHISPIYQSCSLTSTNCCRLQSCIC